jgi:hypothetical protein
MKLLLEQDITQLKLLGKNESFPMPDITTGITFFVECLIHSAKAILHSAKALPSVTLGKEHLTNTLSAKGSLPSTFFGHSTKTLSSVEKHSAN